MSSTEDQFVIEVEVRVVNISTGEVVDSKGYADMRAHVKSAKTFFPMQAVQRMHTFNDPVKAATYMNSIFNVIAKVKEIP